MEHLKSSKSLPVKSKANKTLPVKKNIKVFSEDEGDERSFRLVPKKVKLPEFYVSDQYGNFFCGYRDAYPYWSNKISEAKELTEDSHFNTLIRWEKGIRQLKQEYL